MRQTALVVEILAYSPTEFYHCTHCEVIWHNVGVGPKVHAEQRMSALPDDLAQEYSRIAQWVHSLFQRYDARIVVKLVDAASLEGFVKSLWYNIHRYPAFVVGGKDKYIGTDYSKVDALVAERLASRPVA